MCDISRIDYFYYVIKFYICFRYKQSYNLTGQRAE